MFTGLVEEIGTVNRINMGNNSGTIGIKAGKILNNTKMQLFLKGFILKIFPKSEL